MTDRYYDHRDHDVLRQLDTGDELGMHSTNLRERGRDEFVRGIRNGLIITIIVGAMTVATMALLGYIAGGSPLTLRLELLVHALGRMA